MPDFSISHHHRPQDWDADKPDKSDKADKGNISIKQLTGRGLEAREKDEIETSQRTYRETRVPNVDRPELDPHDPHASNAVPKSRPQRPGAAFFQNMEKAFHNLPAGTLRLLNASNPEEARAILKFAYTHPHAAVDPEVREIVERLIDRATNETQESFNLDADWTPPSPPRAQYNAEIAKNFNDNFATLLSENASPQEAEKLLFAHHHPEFRDRLTPEQQTTLRELEQTATEQTQADNSLPEGWKLPHDSSSYDNAMSATYDQAFDRAVRDQPELTPQQRLSLRTLHRFPNAKVPGRDNLQNLLRELNHQAFKAAQERFGFPDDLKLSPQSDVYKATMMGSFQDKFTKAILKKLRQGEITPEQARLLLASKGINPAKIPANLHAIYAQARQEAAKGAAKELGLPENWEPSETSGEDSPEGVKKGGQEASVRDADGNVRVRANTAVHGKTTDTSQTEEIAPLEMPASNRDRRAALKVIRHVTTFAATAQRVTSTYFTGPQHMYIGEAMMAVSHAMDNLRDSVYALETATAKVANKLQLAEVDTQINKIKKQKRDIEEARRKAKKKEFAGFKLLKRFLPKKVVDHIVRCVQVALWSIDIVLGGVIAMIAKSAKLGDDLVKSPFVQWGWISEEDSQWVDLALSIVFIAIEIAISSLLCQPELVALQVAQLTAQLSAQAVTIAIRMAIQAAMRAAAQIAAKIAAKVASKAATKVATKVATKATQWGAKAALKQGAKVAFQQSLKQGLKQLSQKIGASIAESTVASLIKQGAKASTKAGRAAIKAAIKKSMETLVRTSGKTLAKNIAKRAKDFAKLRTDKYIRRPFQTAKQVVTEIPDVIQHPLAFTQKTMMKGFKGFKAGEKVGSVGDVGGAKAAGKAAEEAAQEAAENAAKQAAKSAAKESAQETSEQTAQEATEQVVKDTTESITQESADASKGSGKGAGEGGEGGGEGGVQGVGEGGGGAGKSKGIESKMLTETDDAAQDAAERMSKKMDDAADKLDDEVKEEVVDETVEELTEQLVQELESQGTGEIGEKVKMLLKEGVKKTLKNKLKKQGKTIKKRGFQDTITTARKGAEGPIGKAKAGIKAGRQWVEDQVKEGLEQAAKKATKGLKSSKQTDEAAESQSKLSKTGRYAEESARELRSLWKHSPDSMMKDTKMFKNMDDADEMARLARSTRRANRMANRRIQTQQTQLFNFAMNMKDYMQNTISFGSSMSQMFMYLRQSKETMKTARRKAAIQELEGYSTMQRKAVSALLDGLGEMGEWVNDINQQQASYWKKMEIRYISA